MKTHLQILLFIFIAVASSCKTRITSVNVTEAYPFPVENVLLKDSYIQHRESLNTTYLKSLDSEQLLHNFRINAGLPSTSHPLGGWESADVGLRGHFVGHYLSASSFIVKKNKDSILCKKLDYLIDELLECQIALGKGYLSAFPETDFSILEAKFGEVWAPYYTYHKIMQGLLDVYVNTHNKKAYTILLGMADYIDVRMSKLDDKTISKMLYTPQANPMNEPGGMNEVLYKLFNISRDDKHLKLAQIFDRKWFLLPLANNHDILSGLHSNTHIALVNGFAECYAVTKNSLYYKATANFWDMLMLSHAYVNGSSSGPRPNVTTPTSLTSEHWGVPNQLSNTLTKEIAETCVSHNTQKLTGKLFEWTLNPKYADAYMNTFYNSIMALQNNETGEYVYHLPLGSPRQKRFLTNYNDFRCCNGSSIEAFSLLNNNIYFHNERNLWVNLYIPTKLNWDKYGLQISQDGDFIREQKAEFTLKLESAQDLTINLFIPSWSRHTQIFVNDILEGTGSPNSFYTLNKEWNDGDRISIQFNFDFHIKHMPDDENMIAIFNGPILLAFQSPDEICLTGSSADIKALLTVSDKTKLQYTLKNGDKLYQLRPLFEIKDEHYSVYVRTNKLLDE